MEQPEDGAAAAAWARRTRMSLLWACWSSWPVWAGATPRRARAKRTERPRYHREWADASVRRTGLGATTCVNRRGTCRITIIADLEHHFFLANRELIDALFDLLRPLVLDNDLCSQGTVERTLQSI